MSECVVTSCDREAVTIVGKPTPWGAWEYRVCDEHQAAVDRGARIDDNPDGRTITLGDPD